ncbi:MAG: hypothetical protein IAF94_24720 [Pirellulaceae bacterium]|nr:hypothetical protein [Pirellulaceae bacterium]
MKQMLCLTLLLLPTVSTPQLVRGEDTPAEPKTLREFMDLATKWYEVYEGADAKEPAQTLVALRWANNARGSEDGMTLLFIHEGRPLAAACVYPWAKRLEHDFESLSRGKIVAKRDGAVVWQPQQAGVTFADLPGAPAPEGTRTQRLRQMKGLADKFKATMLGWKVDSTDREELRLLTRPLYRYEPKEGSDLMDGAVFAFVMGTDPEVILLLEAVKDKGAAKWQYGFARRTSGELEARLGETVVWKAARFPTQNDQRLPHFTRGTPLPASIAAELVEEEKTK